MLELKLTVADKASSRLINSLLREFISGTRILQTTVFMFILRDNFHHSIKCSLIKLELRSIDYLFMN